MKNKNLLIKDWDEKPQLEFWNAYKKKRSQKLFFVKEVAGKLFFGNEQKVAIDLLSYFVDDYKINKIEILEKEKYPVFYKKDIIKFCLRIGRYYEKIDNWVMAETYYFKGESIYKEKEQNLELILKTSYEGYLSLAELYIKIEEPSKAKNMLQRLEKSNKKIHLWGRFMTLHKKLAYLTNDFSESDRIHKDKIRPYYNELENEWYKNVKDQVSNDLEKAAEAIIIYHHIVCSEIYLKNKVSLEKLDFLLKNKVESEDGTHHIESYKRDFLNRRLIPELGAYIGEVLLNEFNGNWIKADKLMKARISISNRIINPFEYSYKVVCFGHRLIEEVYNPIKMTITNR